MNANLANCKVALLVTDGFEQVELTEPRKALDAAGAATSSRSTCRSSRRASRTSTRSCCPGRDQPRPPAHGAEGGAVREELLEAGCARGRRIASWPSLKTDLRNAGAEWIDREVVVDGKLVTSRKPDDLPAFNREMCALFARSGERARAAA